MTVPVSSFPCGAGNPPQNPCSVIYFYENKSFPNSLPKTKFPSTFTPEKINVGALGNIVRQLHIHIVARRTDDPAWPGPVWGHSPAVPYTAEQLVDMQSRLASGL